MYNNPYGPISADSPFQPCYIYLIIFYGRIYLNECLKLSFEEIDM